MRIAVVVVAYILAARQSSLYPHINALLIEFAHDVVKIDVSFIAAGTAHQHRISATDASVLREVDYLLFIGVVMVDPFTVTLAAIPAGIGYGNSVLAGQGAVCKLTHNFVVMRIVSFGIGVEVTAHICAFDADNDSVIPCLGARFGIPYGVVRTGISQPALLAGAHFNADEVAALVVVLIVCDYH